jgi:hypothetical protein
MGRPRRVAGARPEEAKTSPDPETTKAPAGSPDGEGPPTRPNFLGDPALALVIVVAAGLAGMALMAILTSLR